MGNLISYLNPKRTPDCGIYSSLAKPRCNTVSSLLFEVVKKSFWFLRGSVLGQMSASACFFFQGKKHISAVASKSMLAFLFDSFSQLLGLRI